MNIIKVSEIECSNFTKNLQNFYLKKKQPLQYTGIITTWINSDFGGEIDNFWTCSLKVKIPEFQFCFNILYMHIQIQRPCLCTTHYTLSLYSPPLTYCREQIHLILHVLVICLIKAVELAKYISCISVLIMQFSRFLREKGNGLELNSHYWVRSLYCFQACLFLYGKTKCIPNI